MGATGPAAAGLALTGSPLSLPSIVDIISWRAEHQPDRRACTFLEDGDEEVEFLTYRTLDQQARVLAGRLLQQAVAGDRVLLLHPPGLEFLVALISCFYAGLIAVPLYPPKLNRRDLRLVDVSRDAGARVALTTRSVSDGLDRAIRHTPELAALHCFAQEDFAASITTASGPTLGSPDPSSVAYLQYTSGSTRAPRGVMVSHRNLLANVEDIDRGFRHCDDSVAVSWLPHFHDMGLVYGLMVPLAVGFQSYLMPPASFLQRPLRWLQAMSRFGATHSGGPNFAYDLCTQRITPAQKERLDLTRWAVAFNGAEPVRQQTLAGFASAFAACGFAPASLCPSYGLAEATLKVTTARRGGGPTVFFVSANMLGRGRVIPATEADADRRAVVGCGGAELGTQILVVNPETRVPCPPDEVGEIWVDSASVAQGYWNDPDQSTLVFQAAPSGGTGRYLRTGDLGFLRDGELFVTGRIKDLVIIRGRNHYPQDLEVTVQASHPALRVDGGAAVSVEVGGEERLVIIQEVDRHRYDEAEAAVARIRTAVTDEHEVTPYAVVLVRPNGVPKTSSGKIQRSACARAFLDRTLPVVHEWQERFVVPGEPTEVAARSRDDIETYLLEKLSSTLFISPDDLELTHPFSAMGLDSLRAMTLLGEIELWLGRQLSPTLFWNYPTVARLAAHLAETSPDGAALSLEPE